MDMTQTTAQLASQTIAALRSTDTGAALTANSATWNGTVGEARDAVDAAITSLRSGVNRKFTTSEAHTLRALETLESQLAQAASWSTINGSWLTVVAA